MAFFKKNPTLEESVINQIGQGLLDLYDIYEIQDSRLRSGFAETSMDFNPSSYSTRDFFYSFIRLRSQGFIQLTDLIETKHASGEIVRETTLLFYGYNFTKDQVFSKLDANFSKIEEGKWCIDDGFLRINNMFNEKYFTYFKYE